MIRPIPQRRVMDKLDEYMSRLDYPAVERHLLYWLEEARQGNDKRGELFVRGEMAGHYRKTGERDKAEESAREALRLVDELGMEGTVSAGTAYVNAATALHSFGEVERALPLFEKALACYRGRDTDPSLLGGLYNNMGLCLAAAGDFDRAGEMYNLALEEMKKAPHGELERAITCLNMADAAEARLGMEAAEGEIYRLLDQAEALLTFSDAPRDGYFAYVCDKCAPTFAHFGYFLQAEALKKQAEEIYERA